MLTRSTQRKNGERRTRTWTSQHGRQSGRAGGVFRSDSWLLRRKRRIQGDRARRPKCERVGEIFRQRKPLGDCHILVKESRFQCLSLYLRWGYSCFSSLVLAFALNQPLHPILFSFFVRSYFLPSVDATPSILRSHAVHFSIVRNQLHNILSNVKRFVIDKSSVN